MMRFTARKSMLEPKVSIIIPNWNGEKFIFDCLESLEKVEYGNFSIIVVDNGSNDNSVAILDEKYSEIIVLRNAENLGFSAACNRGIKYALNAGANFVLLLNNDTVVSPDFLKKIVKAGEKNEIGIVAPKICFFNHPNVIWCAGGRFVRWRASCKFLHGRENDRRELSGIRECDYVTGCAMLIKREVFNDVQFFFEPYFLTVEDVNFCYDAKKFGWKTVVDFDSCIWHKVSSSQKGEFSFSNGYYGTRNRLFFAFKVMKNYFGGVFLLFIILPVRIIQWTLEGKYQMVKGIISAIRDFLRGKMGKINS